MELWKQTIADKDRFHREGAKVLRQVAKHLGLARGQFDIRSNRGGSAVGGEVILHSDHLYLWISGNGYVIGRRCHGRKDFGTGLDCPNKDFDWALLADPKSLADHIRLAGLEPRKTDGNAKSSTGRDV